MASKATKGRYIQPLEPNTQDALKAQAEVDTIGQPDESSAAAEVNTRTSPIQKPLAKEVAKPNSPIKTVKVVTTQQFQPINKTPLSQFEGQEIIESNDGEELEEVVFLAENKSLQVYIPDYEIMEVDGEKQAVPVPTSDNKQSMKKIKFAQGVFRTNNPTTIHQLRNEKTNGKYLIGKIYFEGTLPSWVLEKQRKYSEFFTRDPLEHEMRESAY